MQLPDDVSKLILTYASEPIYTQAKWVDNTYKDTIYIELFDNPRAYRWAKQNWSRISNKTKIIQNPHPKIIELITHNLNPVEILSEIVKYIHIHSNLLNKLIDSNPIIPVLLARMHINFLIQLLLHCPDLHLIKKIIKLTPEHSDLNLYKLLSSHHDEPLLYALHLVENTENPLSENIFNLLLSNPNPIAIKYIYERISKTHPRMNQFIGFLSGNPCELALDIIEDNIELMNQYAWANLNANINPRAYDLVIKHNKISWSHIATNPNAIELIRTKLEEIREYILFDDYPDISFDNYADILFCTCFLEDNPKCTELLDENIDIFEHMGLIHSLSVSKDPKLIDWVGTHQEYAGYSENIKNMIDILKLARTNPNILSNNYLGRYPAKLVKFLRSDKIP